MKHTLKTLIIISLLFGGLQSYSASICPTTAEVQEKENYFQIQSIKNMSLESPDPEITSKILHEQEIYHEKLYYGCMNYFKTNKNPDCSRLMTLTTGYLLLSEKKQPIAKAQLTSLIEKLNAKCPMEIKTIEAMVK